MRQNVFAFAAPMNAKAFCRSFPVKDNECDNNEEFSGLFIVTKTSLFRYAILTIQYKIEAKMKKITIDATLECTPDSDPMICIEYGDSRWEFPYLGEVDRKPCKPVPLEVDVVIDDNDDLLEIEDVRLSPSIFAQDKGDDQPQ